uniref:Uncharacterized protein n=1 Tax=Micrurus paraensis TaxID=1970185 RepID=A0A2D4JYC6_9SAUR
MANNDNNCRKIAETDHKQWHSNNNGALEFLQEIPLACKQEQMGLNKIDKLIENGKGKVLWDARIQTGKHLLDNTPGLTIDDKKHKKDWVVDIAYPEPTK